MADSRFAMKQLHVCRTHDIPSYCCCKFKIHDAAKPAFKYQHAFTECAGNTLGVYPFSVCSCSASCDCAADIRTAETVH